MKIVLLTYINRSGSTFLANELDKSPTILACPEADCLLDIFLIKPNLLIRPGQINKTKKKILSDPKFEAWQLGEETLNNIDFSQTCFEIFYQLLNTYRLKTKPLAEIVVYKAEGLFHVLTGKYTKYFYSEKCEIISIVRDVRAVYNSQCNTNVPESGEIMSKNIFKTCLYWNSYIQKMITDYPCHQLLVKYESFIEDYPQSLRQIEQSLAAKNSLYKTGSELYHRIADNHKKIHQNILLPPQPLNIDKWQESLSIKTIRQIEFTSGKYLIKMGYTLKYNELSIKILILIIPQFIEYSVKKYMKRIILYLKRAVYVSAYK